MNYFEGQDGGRRKKVSEISAQMAGISDKDFKNFVIYKGQKFETDVAYIGIYQQAKKSIYVLDDYVRDRKEKSACLGLAIAKVL